MDLSLGSPGWAVIDLIDNIPHFVAAGNFKTRNKKQPLAARYIEIEDQFTILLADFLHFDRIVREDFISRIPDTNQRVFGAWASVDRALHEFGYQVDGRVNPLKLKKKITGSGKAEKEDIAAAVRTKLSLPDDFKFSSSDASDACALILYNMMEEGIIK